MESYGFRGGCLPTQKQRMSRAPGHCFCESSNSEEKILSVYVCVCVFFVCLWLCVCVCYCKFLSCVDLFVHSMQHLQSSLVSFVVGEYDAQPCVGAKLWFLSKCTTGLHYSMHFPRVVFKPLKCICSQSEMEEIDGQCNISKLAGSRFCSGVSLVVLVYIVCRL